MEEILHVYVHQEKYSQQWLGRITQRHWIFQEVRGARKIEKQNTFDQYSIFEWVPGIPILDNMKGHEDEGSDKENGENDIVEEILEKIAEV